MKIVFDIDGTLSDPGHRLHFIQPREDEKKDWDGFYAACGDDPPIPHTVELCRELLSAGHTVEFWTGRNEDVRSVTEQWIADHIRWFTVDANTFRWGECVIKMRSKGDRRRDHILKMQFIDWDHPPDIIFEDRSTVVQAYRERGLTVFQVAEGDF